MVAIDSTPTISIFRKNLGFFVQEKVYKIEDQKFHGFGPKHLQKCCPPESDVFIGFKCLYLIKSRYGFLKFKSGNEISGCLQQPFRSQRDVQPLGADALNKMPTTALKSSTVVYSTVELVA